MRDRGFISRCSKTCWRAIRWRQWQSPRAPRRSRKLWMSELLLLLARLHGVTVLMLWSHMPELLLWMIAPVYAHQHCAWMIATNLLDLRLAKINALISLVFCFKGTLLGLAITLIGDPTWSCSSFSWTRRWSMFIVFWCFSSISFSPSSCLRLKRGQAKYAKNLFHGVRRLLTVVTSLLGPRIKQHWGWIEWQIWEHGSKACRSTCCRSTWFYPRGPSHCKLLCWWWLLVYTQFWFFWCWGGTCGTCAACSKSKSERKSKGKDGTTVYQCQSEASAEG